MRVAEELCAVCGRPATSRDHVPPRCLFSGDRTNLITVPACDDHNNRRSGLDEEFRLHISIDAGAVTPVTMALWKTTLRGLDRNRRMKQELINSARHVPETNLVAVDVDASVFNVLIESITRSLYWWHWKRRLPLDCSIEVAKLQPDADLSIFLPRMVCRAVGETQFLYAYAQLDQRPTVSQWFFVFHGRTIASACTDTEFANRMQSLAPVC